MSLQKGNIKRTRAQKYQNSFAYKIKAKLQPEDAKLAGLPISQYLCPSCEQIIAWKKQYNKYKPLTAPRRCSTCSEKNVVFAYMVHCENCCKKDNKCAKCSGADLIKLRQEKPIEKTNNSTKTHKEHKCCCEEDVRSMSTEEILTHFPEYRKEFEEKGRLPERILKTIERRIAKGEGHHEHKHGKHSDEQNIKHQSQSGEHSSDDDDEDSDEAMFDDL